ncbi:hypothetical protein IW262DRAFT_1498184, partial [Armillaria fumosa]
MPELQFQSESSSLFDFPQYTPSYCVHDNQSLGHDLFINSAGDFNQSAPTRHDPELTTQFSSHSYPHDNPQAPPFLPREYSTPTTNRHLPVYINSLTYACPPETLPEHAQFLQPAPVSCYDSAPMSDLTDFATFDYNTWHSDQEILGPSTSTTDTIEQTLVHPAHPRDSSDITYNRYHPYAQQRPYKCVLVRLDTSHSPSSSIESTSSPSEQELPLLRRAFKPKLSESDLRDQENHRPFEVSNTTQDEDSRSDDETLTVSPLPSD